MKTTTSWEQLPLVLGVQDVTDVIGYGAYRIRELCRNGAIPCIRLGRAYRIPREALRKWLDQEAAGNNDPLRTRYGRKSMIKIESVRPTGKFVRRDVQ